MPLDPAHILALYRAVGDKARATGLFQDVIDHESDNPPGRALTCSVIVGPLEPVGAASGLSIASARLEFTVRMEAPRTAKNPGETDRALLFAGVSVMAGYIGDFELVGVPDGLVRNVDMFGAHGNGLSFKPGWFPQGEVAYRMADVTVPLILNDVFSQGA